MKKSNIGLIAAAFSLILAASKYPDFDSSGNGVVSIRSTKEIDIVTFEIAAIGSDNKESGYLGKHQTPYTLTVSSTDYQVLIHKLDGVGDMEVVFETSSEGGNIGNVTTYQPIMMIVKRGTHLHSIGLGSIASKGQK